MTAGADAVFLGEGDFNVSATAGKDVFVYALGDVRGSYDAGRDASVVTFGNFHARLHAGRDVGGEIYGLQHPGVWAKGNITGVIDANRNVGGYDDHTPAIFDETRYPVIFAGGAINADIYARNTSHQPIGGKIGSVGAHGDIHGLFKAESAIDEVFSSGDIDAILDAPFVAGTRDNDPSVITDYPLPATPDSVKPQVLADAALVHAEVLADVDAVFTATDELMAAIAALEAEVHDSVATTRTEIALANESTKKEIEEHLQTIAQAIAAGFAQLRQQMQAEFDRARSDAKTARGELAGQIEDVRKLRDRGYSQAASMPAENQQILSVADAALAARRQRILEQLALADIQRRRQIVESQKAAARDATQRSVDGKVVMRMLDPETMKANLAKARREMLLLGIKAAIWYWHNAQNGPAAVLRRPVQAFINAREAGHGLPSALHQAFAVHIFDNTPLMGIYRSWYGEDPVTARKLGRWERGLDGGLALLQILSLGRLRVPKLPTFTRNASPTAKARQLNASINRKWDSNPGLFGRRIHTHGRNASSSNSSIPQARWDRVFGKGVKPPSASVGTSSTTNYTKTFFDAHPHLKGKVVVHHAIEQQVLTRYPGRFTASEIHSLENLRGIPNKLNPDLHYSKIRKEWNRFYKKNPNATRQQILDEATRIDQLFGGKFTPSV